MILIFSCSFSTNRSCHAERRRRFTDTAFDQGIRKITDPAARRMVVLFAEKQLKKQEAKVERASRS
jgi:hypothetical protein